MTREAKSGEYQEARELAVAYIGSNFNRSHVSIVRKLMRAGYDQDLAWQVARDLAAIDYLSDYRAAEIAVARHQGRMAKGDYFLRNLLYEQGISRAAIEETMAKLRPEPERLKELCEAIESKLMQKGKIKAYRFLASRGFSSDNIRSNLESIFARE